MDEAYSQHASQARRKNRSTTNLHRLTLSPLTTKPPLRIGDVDDDFGATSSYSYLQGRSAPTTPGLITRALVPAAATSITARIGKSKSTTQLTGPPAVAHRRVSRSGYTTPIRRGAKALGWACDDAAESRAGHGDSNWLLRAGALLSTEARESKGQSWLVSRESSTSLGGMMRGDADAEALEMELARERIMASRMASRRSSGAAAAAAGSGDGDGESPLDHRTGSHGGSRTGSRSQSTPGAASAAAAAAPHQDPESLSPDYFTHRGSGLDHGTTPGPDFVNPADRLEATGQQDTTREDEVAVRRLVRMGNSGPAAWVGNLLGFTLFSVSENEEGSGRDEGEGGEEDEDDDDDEEEEEEGEGGRMGPGGSRKLSAISQFEGASSAPEERIPAPGPDEGGWRDAAWLLSVASRVLL